MKPIIKVKRNIQDLRQVEKVKPKQSNLFIKNKHKSTIFKKMTHIQKMTFKYLIIDKIS